MIFIYFYIIFSKQASHQGSRDEFFGCPENKTDDENQTVDNHLKETKRSENDILCLITDNNLLSGYTNEIDTLLYELKSAGTNTDQDDIVMSESLTNCTENAAVENLSDNPSSGNSETTQTQLQFNKSASDTKDTDLDQNDVKMIDLLIDIIENAEGENLSEHCGLGNQETTQTQLQFIETASYTIDTDLDLDDIDMSELFTDIFENVEGENLSEHCVLGNPETTKPQMQFIETASDTNKYIDDIDMSELFTDSIEDAKVENLSKHTVLKNLETLQTQLQFSETVLDDTKNSLDKNLNNQTQQPHVIVSNHDNTPANNDFTKNNIERQVSNTETSSSSSIGNQPNDNQSSVSYGNYTTNTADTTNSNDFVMYDNGTRIYVYVKECIDSNLNDKISSYSPVNPQKSYDKEQLTEKHSLTETKETDEKIEPVQPMQTDKLVQSIQTGKQTQKKPTKSAQLIKVKKIKKLANPLKQSEYRKSFKLTNIFKPTELTRPSEQSTKITQENYSKVIFSLDFEIFFNNKGKIPGKMQIEDKKVKKLVFLASVLLNSKKASLKENLEKSLEPENVEKYFIYNYFFDNNLQVKREFLCLILILPEINTMTVLYNALKSKNINIINEELKKEYVNVVINMINEYEKQMNNFAQKLVVSYDSITEYFLKHLILEIKEFRNINIKILTELIKKEGVNTSLNVSNVVFDHGSNGLLKCDDYQILIEEHKMKYCDKIPNISNLKYTIKAEVREQMQLIQYDHVSNEQVNIVTTENNINDINFDINNLVLLSYEHLSTLMLESMNDSEYQKTNYLFLIIFLNRDWLESFSDEKTRLLPMVMLNFESFADRLHDLLVQNRFSNVHHNLHVFLKILLQKYNYTVVEKSFFYDSGVNKLCIMDETKVNSVSVTYKQYIEYIFDRYSEYLLDYYLRRYTF